MKKWLYDTTEGKRADSHLKIGRELKELPDGKRYIITAKLHRVIHSQEQRAYFHVICTIYAVHTGHTMDEIKDEFKRARYYELKVDNFGKEFKRLKSTADADTAEYAWLITNLLQWGSEEWPAVIIPKKEDHDYERWLEIEAAIEEEYRRMTSG